MDPNLLPQDLRSKEEKELDRLKKQSRSFKIELSGVKKEAPASQPKPVGWWSKIFSLKATPPLVLSTPLSDRNQENGFNLLSPQQKSAAHLVAGAKPAVVKMPAPKEVPLPKKSNWFSRAAGQPVSPIKNAPISAPAFKVGPPNFPPAIQPKPLTPAPFKSAVAINHPANHYAAPAESRPKSPYHLAPKRERGQEFNVNLMPEELAGGQTVSWNSEIKTLLLAIVSATLILTVAYGLLIFLQTNLETRMAARQQEFNDLEKQIGDFISQEKQNNALADRVALVKTLLNQHISWTNFFGRLEKYTLDGVYYTDLAADTSGVLLLPGVADNYNVLARQLAVFKQASDFTTGVGLANAQLYSADKAGVLGVSFQMRLNLNSNVFRKVSNP